MLTIIPYIFSFWMQQFVWTLILIHGSGPLVAFMVWKEIFSSRLLIPVLFLFLAYRSLFVKGFRSVPPLPPDRFIFWSVNIVPPTTGHEVSGHRWRRDAEPGKSEAVPPFLCGSGSPLPAGRSNTSSGVSVRRLRYGCLVLAVITCFTWMDEACLPCRRVVETSSHFVFSSWVGVVHLVMHGLYCVGRQTISVADPDPRSVAFLTPGSGIGFFPDPGSWIPNPYFWELSDNFLGKKFYNSWPKFFFFSISKIK